MYASLRAILASLYHGCTDVAKRYKCLLLRHGQQGFVLQDSIRNEKLQAYRYQVSKASFFDTVAVILLPDVRRCSLQLLCALPHQRPCEVTAIDVFVGHHLHNVTFGRRSSNACGRCHPWVAPPSTCVCILCKFARRLSVSHGWCNSSSGGLAYHQSCWIWELGTSGHNHGTRTTLNILG